MSLDYNLFFNETLIRQCPQPSDIVGPPTIGIDECANNRILWSATSRAHSRGLVERVVRLWFQLRQRADGTFFTLTGPAIKGALPPGVDHGEPVKGVSCPDKHIVDCLLVNLVRNDRVVLLSENILYNVGGLKRILLEEVRPVIEAHHRSRFGLLAFMKRRRTTWQSYSDSLIHRLESSGVAVGFEYLEV
jgi:hypothetical protein